MVQSNGNNIELAHSHQDLVGEPKNRKKYWVMGGGLIVVIIVIVAISVILLTVEAAEEEHFPTINLDDFLYDKLSAARFNGSWISDTEIEYIDEEGNAVVYDARNKTKRILSQNEILRQSFQLQRSPDQKYMLMAFQYNKIYRHTFKATFSVMDLATQQIMPLVMNNDLLNSYFDLVIWGATGSQLLYVYERNIYYMEHIGVAAKQITTDGSALGAIYNGVPDWVYEEEIFSSNTAAWFSPDGSRLAFVKFDDKEVQEMTIPVYGPVGAKEFQYTKAVSIKYPKAGTANPTVSVHVVDLKSISLPNVIELSIPVELQNEKRKPIVSAVTWANNNTLSAVWMNRVQNRAYIIACEITTVASCKTIFELQSNPGWVELFTPPLFNKDVTKMVLIAPVKQSNNDSYRHVISVDLKTKLPKPLTEGEFTVTEILTWDHDRGFIYYMANVPKDPAVLHLYRVKDGENATCISCQVLAGGRYHSAEISTGGSYIVLSSLGPNVPEINIYSQNSFEHIGLWEDNKELNEIVSKKLLPQILRLQVDIGGGMMAQVKLVLPLGLDTSGQTKYPMIVNVYGGPDSFQVTEKWGIDWGTYMAANRSIIYAAIDGRGSGLKGERMLHANYRKLGTLEIDDQINITKHLQNTLEYIDKDRTAIWGWSYGGYASAMALGQDTTDVFKCAVSVAPVTDWRLYDSIYTERFMGIPEDDDNLEGYDKSLVVNYAENFRNKKYFVIHGTYDDNVHFQQAMMFVKILELKDIQFDQMTYSDEDHSLARVRPHLYHSLERFFGECFE